MPSLAADRMRLVFALSMLASTCWTFGIAQVCSLGEMKTEIAVRKGREVME